MQSSGVYVRNEPARLAIQKSQVLKDMVDKKQEGLKLHPSLYAQPLLNVLNIKLDHGFIGYGKVFYAEKIVGVPRENVFDSVVKEWEDTKKIFFSLSAQHTQLAFVFFDFTLIMRFLNCGLH